MEQIDYLLSQLDVSGILDGVSAEEYRRIIETSSDQQDEAMFIELPAISTKIVNEFIVFFNNLEKLQTNGSLSASSMLQLTATLLASIRAANDHSGKPSCSSIKFQAA
jgi:hypothetical protein